MAGTTSDTRCKQDFQGEEIDIVERGMFNTKVRLSWQYLCYYKKVINNPSIVAYYSSRNSAQLLFTTSTPLACNMSWEFSSHPGFSLSRISIASFTNAWKPSIWLKQCCFAIYSISDLVAAQCLVVLSL